jgi:hypothetical protein
MSWVITPAQRTDPDALAYLAEVERADGQALESGTRDAVIAFVTGCKADGIWTAIKASCILAGARTLAGALVPLAGAAPANLNFVSGDYNRKTGLVGDGSTKYLNSNRSNSSEPQNLRHLSFYASSLATLNSVYLSTTTVNTSGDSYVFANSTNTTNTIKLSSSGTPGGPLAGASFAVGFSGANRSVNSSITARRAGVSLVDSITPGVATSVSPLNENIMVFGISGFYSNARLAFYSIGESLDLALLDARVTTLVNAFAAAIP